MSVPVTVLLLLDLGCIGLLPVVFFRRDGRLNARWWLTAGPFALCAAFLAAAALGRLTPMGRHGAAGSLLDALAVALAAASIALIFLTVGVHRIPLALWHQEDDAPRELVTWGPYRRVRHPFYVAFLLALAGAAAHAPHPLSLAVLAYGFAVLNHTAAREEARLSRSELGAAYQEYMRRTGRFLPVAGRGGR
jgi:protein-S-isoprenylcysteine O-methyltransferase Ste14